MSVIELDAVSKRFGGVRALDRVSVGFRAGEVHAIVGENGAGKSTLMKVLAGIHPPDSGSYLLDGEGVRLGGPRDALECGIAIVHQELNLFPHLSITANLFAGRERARTGLLDRGRMHDETRKALQDIGVSLDPGQRASALTIGEKQLVEIGRALQQDSRILILDEPNSALNETESGRLFEIIRDLRGRGLAIIYVSHRLEEVFAIADRITVLRDGRRVETMERPSASIAGVIEQMIGRKPSDSAAQQTAPGTAEAALSVRNLETRSGVGPLSFDATRGEILGFAGLEGSGITQLFQALFGLEPVRRGVIARGGKELPVRSPVSAIASGLAMIPASRRDEGLMMPWSIRRNSTLLILRKLTRLGGFIDPRKTRTRADEFVRSLRIATDSIDKPVQWLSGGNQQKTLIAKWLAVNPSILILNDPTRGVDVGAKEEIHAIIRDLAAGGITILLASSEIEETLALSHRALVLHKGRVFAEYQTPADKADVLHAMSGMTMETASKARTT